MSARYNSFVPASALLLAVAVGTTLPAAATAQVQLSGPVSYFDAASGLTVLPGTNASVAASATGNTVTATYVGDIVTSLTGGPGAGTFQGFTFDRAIVPFTVGALPVRIGEASMHANFKLVASGGNGVQGGNDPIITATILTRLYQQLGGVQVPISDPWLSAIEFTQSYTQNGNGLQVIDASFGPASANYILTPGNYYLYEQINVTTSFTSNGGVQPGRGMTVEFGGDLSSGYSGIQYTFAWETVPTPGAAALMTLGGLAAMRRRR